MLVQAVSLLRQRKLDEVVKSLNNLLAANRVRARATCYHLEPWQHLQHT